MYQSQSHNQEVALDKVTSGRDSILGCHYTRQLAADLTGLKIKYKNWLQLQFVAWVIESVESVLGVIPLRMNFNLTQEFFK